MASILDLVNQLIGGILAGNAGVGTPALQRPPFTPSGIGTPPLQSLPINTSGIGTPNLQRPPISNQGIGTPSLSRPPLNTSVMGTPTLQTPDSAPGNKYGPGNPYAPQNSNDLVGNTGDMPLPDYKPGNTFSDKVPFSPNSPSAIVDNNDFANNNSTYNAQTIFPLGQLDPRVNPILNTREMFSPRDPPSLLSNPPDTSKIANNLYDNNFPNLLTQGGQSTLGAGTSLSNFDPFAISHWARNVAGQVYFAPSFQSDPISKQGFFKVTDETLKKSAAWVASNFLLASLNIGDPQAYGVGNLVWNPLSFPSALLPARGISPTEHPTIGTMISDYKTNLNNTVFAPGERLLLMRQGLYSQVAPVKRLQQLQSPIMAPGFIGDTTSVGNNGGHTLENGPNFPPLSIDAATGGDAEFVAQLAGMHTNLYTPNRPYSQQNAAFPLDKLQTSFQAFNVVGTTAVLTPGELKNDNLFINRPFPGGAPGQGSDMTYVSAPVASQTRGTSTPIIDNGDAYFDPLDEQNGFLQTPIADSQNYMPFSFFDLREPGAGKFLYFRAYLKAGFNETFTPEWNEERFFGRVDQIPTYVGTTRTINLAFDMVVWGPRDLPVIYNKLQRLQSMVYPMYDSSGFFLAGPIIRVRVGDLIAGANGVGLPGYITSLDMSYDETVWQIDKDLKVPMKITISISYTVLHEANPGLYKSPDTGQLRFGTASPDPDTKQITTISAPNIRKIFGSVGS
jgi:hypothetical protein